MSTFYEYSAEKLNGETKPLSKYKGKVVLVVNTASLWGLTVRDFTQMNELMDKYSSKGLSILGFPSNQFGHQENCSNSEVLDLLKYVRPGNGFVPKIDMFNKVEVNGANAHPLYKYLKHELPYPADDPVSLMGNNTFIIWNPVERSDISWNFEKFLISADGIPLKRYSKRFEAIKLADDIEEALKKK